MTNLCINMGRHAEWRKIAKRERRKRIRTIQAKERDKVMLSDFYMKQQELELELLLEQITKQNEEENEKWMRAELIANTRWKKLLEERERHKQKRLEQEAKLKLEWELEQKQKQIEEERIAAAKEELKRKQDIFMNNLDKFLSGDSDEPPAELKVMHETRPDAALCPFFSKTACCRFGDQCSRNHQYPGISKVLLGTNFYVHFGLSNANLNEYDTDIMLEYEENDTYKEFKEFFYDVLSEFEKFGRIIQFKVCNNYEKHLRGNTYVEFAELRSAVAAYRSLHTRWYGGRQLSLQFCLISSWKNAVCGLQLRRRCPKGRACNFLHVFRNPNNLFNGYNNDVPDKSRSSRSSVRSWRWSESPETDVHKRINSSRSDRSSSITTTSDKRRRRSRYSDDDDDDNHHRRHSPRRSKRR
nr:U2 small nuclear ribonucleoprotein auxiliary factor 35 kDa subunit-related protein 2 [Helicoverpa armigera]